MPDTRIPLPLSEALGLVAFRAREGLDQTDPDTIPPGSECLSSAYYALRNALHDILTVVRETQPPPF